MYSLPYVTYWVKASTRKVFAFYGILENLKGSKPSKYGLEYRWLEYYIVLGSISQMNLKYLKKSEFQIRNFSRPLIESDSNEILLKKSLLGGLLQSSFILMDGTN